MMKFDAKQFREFVEACKVEEANRRDAFVKQFVGEVIMPCMRQAARALEDSIKVEIDADIMREYGKAIAWEIQCPEWNIYAYTEDNFIVVDW